MHTDPGHIHAKDPGKTEGNVVFEYLDAFGTDKKKITELKGQYEQGGLGDVIVKNYLVEVLEELLMPIREKRREAAKDPTQVMKMLKQGTGRAREAAAQTLKDVREAMGLIY